MKEAVVYNFLQNKCICCPINAIISKKIYKNLNYSLQIQLIYINKLESPEGLNFIKIQLLKHIYCISNYIINTWNSNNSFWILTKETHWLCIVSSVFLHAKM